MPGYVIPSVILLKEEIEYNSDMLEEYHGYAIPGSSTAEPVWRIVRLEYNSNKLQSASKWANKGVSNARWTERTTLSYD